jgi:hypothetical protein
LSARLLSSPRTSLRRSYFGQRRFEFLQSSASVGNGADDAERRPGPRRVFENDLTMTLAIAALRQDADEQAERGITSFSVRSIGRPLYSYRWRH